MADVIVIGAGHNGLVAATRIARTGREVVVLEARESAGGLCAEIEFHPGYRAPGVLHDTGGLRYPVIRELDLTRHGLALLDEPPPVYAPQVDGEGLVLHRSPELARPELERLSPADAAGYAAWRGWIGRVGGFVSTVLSEKPPPLTPDSAGDMFLLARRGLALRRLGKADMLELMRVSPMCAADWLQEYFPSQLLCELLAAPGVQGTYMGPWSAGSSATLLFREAVFHREVRGGPAAVARALVAAAEEAGVEIRTSSRVARIRIGSGGVEGVTLTSGAELDARSVAAACDPKQTFLQLVDPAWLSADLEHRMTVYRSRGTTAKVHLALNGPLVFPARPNQAFESIRVGGGEVDSLERAYDAIKYGRFSARPHLDIRVPSVADPSVAPSGHHVASILVSFVPYDLDGGWNAARRAELGETVLSTLETHAPDLRHRVEAMQVMTPPDIEAEWGATGGHLDHGEHALDQLLFMRPSPAVGRYATPIRGLFLAASGSHPGGGVTGAPGLLAAETLLTSS